MGLGFVLYWARVSGYPRGESKPGFQGWQGLGQDGVELRVLHGGGPEFLVGPRETKKKKPVFFQRGRRVESRGKGKKGGGRDSYLRAVMAPLWVPLNTDFYLRVIKL